MIDLKQLTEKQKLSSDDILEILKYGKEVNKIIDKAKDHAKKFYPEGFEGKFKIVTSMRPSGWLDSDKALESLRSLNVPEDNFVGLLSPSEVKKNIALNDYESIEDLVKKIEVKSVRL